MSKPRWRWHNVPVPEAYVSAFVVGGTLHVLVPYQLGAFGSLARAVGAPLFVTGIALAAWSVAAAGEALLDKPTSLVTGGPYRFSRNPMYLAWACMGTGAALVADSAWLLLAALLAFARVHLVQIPREEAELEERFVEHYPAYKRRVRRYL